MRHLNYNHLLYFWTVAREGSIASAASRLHLTPQTVSGQIKRLEDTLGQPLFERDGRNLTLTRMGHTVAEFADDIFALGQELAQVAKRGVNTIPRSVSVGIVNSIPRLEAYRLVRPATLLEEPIRLIITQGTLDDLMGSLVEHRLDVVISDRPVSDRLQMRLCTHALGGSDIAFYASPRLLGQLSGPFPECLNGAPLIMPEARSPLRARLENWIAQHGVSPMVVAEVDDSALMKALGRAGFGVFPSLASIADEIEESYGARVLGVAKGVEEAYWAVSADRKLEHAAVRAIADHHLNQQRERLRA